MAATLPFFSSVVRRAVLLLAAAALAAVAFNACRPSPLPWRADWSHHVETLARQHRIPLVYLPEFRAALASTPPAVAVDARPAAEFAAAHVPGAFSLPADSSEDAFAALYRTLGEDLSAPLVAYCRDISCDDALTLALALRARGWSSVRLYPGGFAEWTAYHGPVEPPPDADPVPGADPASPGSPAP